MEVTEVIGVAVRSEIQFLGDGQGQPQQQEGQEPVG